MPAFRTLMGPARPRRRMVDEELILRFLALEDRYPRYQPPLKRFLNEYMFSVKAAGQPKLDRYRSLFQGTVERADSFLGRSAFRVLGRDGNPVESVLNRALWDAHMLVLAHVRGSATALRRERLKLALGALHQDPEFDDAIRRATGDRSRLRLRVARVVGAFRDAGVEVDIPPAWD
jgi:hypothetical protein